MRPDIPVFKIQSAAPRRRHVLGDTRNALLIISKVVPRDESKGEINAMRR